MTGSVTDAIAEAYATQPAGVSVIETLQFDHVSFADGPVRLATGTKLVPENTVATLPNPSTYVGPRTVLCDADGYLYIILPLSLSGPKAWFVVTQIAVTPPGMGPDGVMPMRVRVDNVAGVMLPYVRGATQATDPIAVVYRAYTTADLTQPGEVFSGFELREVEMSAMAVEASLGLRQVEMQAFPSAIYSEDYYPALQST